ncbi:MAG: glycosyltransferase family 2 protein, partial [Flavobacteriaceae bacterium]
MKTTSPTPTDPKEAPNGHIDLPLVTLILPAYNEAEIITDSLHSLSYYMASLEDRFRWEILIVNDGSKDNTGPLADAFAVSRDNIRVHHHRVNRNLGVALRSGFQNAKGDFVVVLDMDLSYAPEHIERLLDTMLETDADIVVASPYMKGGKNTKVPFTRLLLSKTINKLMRFTSSVNIHTFTGMVRAYRNDFLANLNLKSSTYSINPEIIHKAGILRAKVVEIPAHLDWSYQLTKGKNRTSGIRIYKGILLGLMSGFIFRPYGFFMAVCTFFFFIFLFVLWCVCYCVFLA